jgi:hypothetical protein
MRLAAAAFAGCLTLAAALAEPNAPDFSVVPLTRADFDLYLAILRAAATHNAHLTGDDKAAVDLTVQMQRHPPKVPVGGHMPTPAEMNQMIRIANLSARAATLASYDDMIAQQRGVAKRYEAIKNEIETVLAQITGVGGSCGGDCTPPGGFSAAQLARAKKETDIANADRPLIAPHAAEIASLKKQIGGFMFGGR